MATDDLSNGWEAIAPDFSVGRSGIGLPEVMRWAGGLEAGSTILDVGCASGKPLAVALAAEGFAISGIDASPTLLAAFRKNLPGAQAMCEAAENSTFFGQQFDAAMAIGLVFLLPEAAQRKLLTRLPMALKPGGRLLFTAPRQACSWADALTGRDSLSLGQDEYERLLSFGGLELSGTDEDVGGNVHYAMIKRIV